MSDTPRTDAERIRVSKYPSHDHGDLMAAFADKLERENADLRARLEETVSEKNKLQRDLDHCRAGFNQLCDLYDKVRDERDLAEARLGQAAALLARAQQELVNAEAGSHELHSAIDVALSPTEESK